MIELVPTWTNQTEHVAKANALVINEQSIIIGGLCKKGKGVIEIWDKHAIAASRTTL